MEATDGNDPSETASRWFGRVYGASTKRIACRRLRLLTKSKRRDRRLVMPEPGIPADTVAELQRRGHKIEYEGQAVAILKSGTYAYGSGHVRTSGFCALLLAGFTGAQSPHPDHLFPVKVEKFYGPAKV